MPVPQSLDGHVTLMKGHFTDRTVLCPTMNSFLYVQGANFKGESQNLEEEQQHSDKIPCSLVSGLMKAMLSKLPGCLKYLAWVLQDKMHLSEFTALLQN